MVAWWWRCASSLSTSLACEASNQTSSRKLMKGRATGSYQRLSAKVYYVMDVRLSVDARCDGNEKKKKSPRAHAFFPHLSSQDTPSG